MRDEDNVEAATATLDAHLSEKYGATLTMTRRRLEGILRRFYARIGLQGKLSSVPNVVAGAIHRAAAGPPPGAWRRDKPKRIRGTLAALERLGWEWRLTRFYSKYSPDKVGDVEKTLLRYTGREELLFAALVKQHGPEPGDAGGVADVLRFEQQESDPQDAAADDSAVCERASVLLDDMVRQQYGVPMVSARHRSLVGAHGKVLQLVLTAEPRGKGGCSVKRALRWKMDFSHDECRPCS